MKDATYPDALVLCAGPKTTELQHMTPVLPLGRQAIRKHQRASSSGDEVGEPTVTIPDPDSIRCVPAREIGIADVHSCIWS